MRNFIAVFILSIFITKSFSQEALDITTSDFTIGETMTFESKILEEERLLNIYLPESYKIDSLKTYPVIYLLDGSKDEDFIHISGLVQFCSFSWINIIPETIVVGIANVDRRRDFTFPTTIEQDLKDFPNSGHSETFIGFIEDEVFPIVQKHYRTDDTKTIIGQSLGGLLATEILLKKPQLFDNYIIVSPSLWWDNESLLEVFTQKFNAVKSIYIAVGKEGDIMENDAKALYKKLKTAEDERSGLFFKFFEEKSHGDVLHAAVYDSFEKIFKLKE